MGVLSKFFLKNSIKNILFLLFSALSMFIIFDIMINIDEYIKESISIKTIFIYYMYKIPSFLYLLIPIMMPLSIILVLSSTIKNNSIVSVISSGINNKKAVKSFFLFALICGIANFILAEFVNPITEPRSKSIETASGKISKNYRTWKIKKTGAAFYAHKSIVTNKNLRLENIVIAPKEGGLIYADKLFMKDKRWYLSGNIKEWDEKKDKCYFHNKDFLLQGKYELPLTQKELSYRLLSRYSMNSIQLYSRKDNLHRAIIYNRIAQIFLPFACLLLVLPLFLRFTNKTKLISAGLSSFVLSILPILVMAIGSMNAEVSTIPSFIVMAITTIIIFIPGIILFYKWNL